MEINNIFTSLITYILHLQGIFAIVIVIIIYLCVNEIITFVSYNLYKFNHLNEKNIYILRFVIFHLRFWVQNKLRSYLPSKCVRQIDRSIITFSANALKRFSSPYFRSVRLTPLSATLYLSLLNYLRQQTNRTGAVWRPRKWSNSLVLLLSFIYTTRDV